MPALPRLKRLFRPLRPVLHPAWRRVRPLVEWNGPLRAVLFVRRSRFALVDRLERRRGHLPAPIRPLRRHEIGAVGLGDAWYRPRTRYISVACDEAASLVRRHDLRTALELGPHHRPVVVGADVMERVVRSDLQAEGQVILHDARDTPWPIEDKRYDLFVALQVFEHLGASQPAAFREVCRVARNAIISLPIDWVMDDPRNCHHRISQERALGWFSPVRPTRVVVGNGGRRRRLIFVFEDLPTPA